MILKWILKTLNGGLDWINLAQSRNRWWAIVNTDFIKCEE
jgi:hypothetical protein